MTTPPLSKSVAHSVLVVDNEPLIARLLDRMLRRTSEVTVATDVDEAVRALEARTYEAVISDLELGDSSRNGIWLLEFAHARINPMRRVLMSGHLALDELFPAGATSISVLQKPFSYQQLLASIRID